MANWLEVTSIQVKMEQDTKTFDVGTPSASPHRYLFRGLHLHVVSLLPSDRLMWALFPTPLIHAATLVSPLGWADTVADSSESLPTKVKLRASPLDLALIDMVDPDQAYTWWSYRDIISWSCPIPNELHLSIVRVRATSFCVCSESAFKVSPDEHLLAVSWLVRAAIRGSGSQRLIFDASSSARTPSRSRTSSSSM
jgi:hypothetical protein